jgi:hypothetical protein
MYNGCKLYHRIIPYTLALLATWVLIILIIVL